MNCFDQQHDTLARKHDMVVDELDNCVCVRKVNTTGGSIHMENDWLWIPAYRSRVQMHQHTPGRSEFVDHDSMFVRRSDVEFHPIIQQQAHALVVLSETISELKKEVADLRAGQPLLGDVISTATNRKLTL